MRQQLVYAHIQKRQRTFGFLLDLFPQPFIFLPDPLLTVFQCSCFSSEIVEVTFARVIDETQVVP